MTEFTLLDLVTAHLDGRGKSVVECLVEFGFASSKSDAKRSIEQGAIKIGHHKIFDTNAKVLGFGGIVLIQTNEDGILDITTNFD